MKLSTALHKLSFGLTFLAFLLTPLFFLPITGEFYEFNKQAILVVVACINLLSWAVSLVADKQVKLTRSPLGLPLLFLTGSWILSTYLKSPNKVEALMEPGQTSTLLALVVIFFTSINVVKTKKHLDTLVHALVGSLTVFSVVSSLYSAGLLDKVGPLEFMKSPLWTTAGNPLSGLVLTLSFIPFIVLLTIKEKVGTLKSFFFSVSLFLAVISSVLSGYRLFKPGSESRPIFLSQSTAWSIAMETLKVSPVWGTGPASYLQSFSQFRPISYNNSPSWSIRFTSTNNYYLQILSTLGVVGLAAYGFLVLKSANTLTKLLKTSSDSPLHSLAIAATVTAVAMFASQVVAPVSITSLSFLFFMLILSISALKVMGSSLVHEANFDIVATSDTGNRSPVLAWILLAISLAVVVPSMYFGVRAYYGEVIFRSALNSAAANKGKDTYDTLLKAFSINPFMDSYRIAYSQANLLIASSLATKTDLTDTDRTTITQLAQQAIREAKNAVALNPKKITSMENLASVYRNLLNYAKGADAWTVASYRQAIQLDPINPNLRIALGGVFYSLKDYDSAIRHFQEAVNLKPDLPNAYYNLSAAYTQKADYRNAFLAMQSVTNLVDKSSADYTKAQGELEQLRTKLGQTQQPEPIAPAKSELETAKPIPSPKVTLPEDLGPEASPKPTKSPAITPTNTP